MGSGQCVPKDSPLTCVLEIFKSLLLIELKGNRLKQLCIQIWPQYQLDNQDRWPEFSAFDFNVLQNLTDFLKRNGKWCRRSPMPKRFGPFGTGPHYAKPAPSTRSFYAPCLPSKRVLLQLTAHLDLPHPQSSTPYPPPCQPSPPPSCNSPTDSETSPDSPSTTAPSPRLPLPPSPARLRHTVTYSTHISPERGGRTRGPHLSPCAIFIVR